MLVSFDGSRLHVGDVLVAHFLESHAAHQHRAQQIPGLRILWIELRRLLQRLDGLFVLVGVVHRDSEIAPRLCGLRRVEFRGLLISSGRFIDFSRAPINSAQVVVISE